jgi:zinc protease
MRDVAFPEVAHLSLENGLTIDVVRQPQLPIVSMELVIQSGSASDPAELPGAASLLADMLKEGTKQKTSAQFAEAVEFLGAHLDTSAGQETLRISINAMSEHLDPALSLVAEAALSPRLDPGELAKLKKRTLDELKLKMDKPVWLARRELAKALYGAHPYARIDTDVKAVKKLKRGDLVAFHDGHFAPNNAFLVVVGDVTPEQVRASAERLFGKWKRKTVSEPSYPAPPTRTGREVIVVDRPASVQSQIALANLALKRNDPSYVPLMVANQVLGGSAASRLFMDLREKRSLTYGAYSRLDESVDVGAIRASAAVRTPVTGEAMAGFYEHLERIVKEATPERELADAQRFLADSFPLQIETADRVAELVSDLRVYGLPDGYWDSFRSSIRKVTADDALKAAQTYIHPESNVVVVVGKAADVVPVLEKYGPVTVVDVEGEVIRHPNPSPAAASPAPTPVPAPPAPAPATSAPSAQTPATKR